MLTDFFQDPILIAAVMAIALPFLAFALIVLFTRAYPHLSAALAIGAVALSIINAFYLILNHWTMKQAIAYSGRWLVSGAVSVSFGFLLDPTSLLMLLVVAGISFLVQVYSLGYMSGDPGFARYYAFQSLFAGAMMALTLSSSLLQLYFFWELVGLCSYLLIGFWYEKFSATEAGKKAFVMTRLGDIAFFAGLLLILLSFGRVDILVMNGPEVTAVMSPGRITLSALLIFGGIVGKSAQFPLLTWLPDAREGPTPVSALLHSATMVAAGVYLLARLFPFLNHSETAMTVFLAIGALTMLMASTMAMVERDIKKLWAYSTISQLGYMIMALAAGSYFAGLFHLTSHAGFKALLFLCSGIWVRLYETNDLYEIGRKSGRKLKTPIICLVLAGASLSGIPPLAGFFSKEAILAGLAALRNPLWLAAGILGVFLTAYYTFRAVFIIIFPKQMDQEPANEIRPRGKAYQAMAWPLLVLAIFILVLGFVETPLRNFLSGPVSEEGHPGWVTALSLVLAISAVTLAWQEFGRKDSPQLGFVERVPLIRNFFAERWYLDRFYRIFLERIIYRTFANLFTRNDQQVIDGGIDGFCKFTVQGGRLVSYLQSGRLRYNFWIPFTVLAVLSLYFFFS